MNFLRKRSIRIALLLAAIQVFGIVWPTAAYALTGGPSQPEVQSFEPVGTSDMVDLFSGDFKYNIPLADIDGYPLNISYSGGVNMDQEASWVGLGWNLNPGMINRDMRGIPDDFKGDEVVKNIQMKPNVTVGLSYRKNYELIGHKKDKKDSFSLDLSRTIGLTYSNYEGMGIELGAGINSSLLEKGGGALSGGLNASYSGTSGLNIRPNLNYAYNVDIKKEKEIKGTSGLNASATYNSRSGLKALNFGWSGSLSGLKTKGLKREMRSGTGGNGQGSAIIYGSDTWTPAIATPMKNFNLNLDFAVGKEIKPLTRNHNFPMYVSVQSVAQNTIIKKAYGFYHLESATDEDMLDMNRENDQPFSENQTKLPIPLQTFDVFSVSAQGVGGTFRIYRNDLPNFRQEPATSTGNNIGLAFDIASLSKFKFGLNISFSHSNAASGNWLSGNDLQSKSRLVGAAELASLPAYEPAYLRQMGEMTRSTTEGKPGVKGYNILTPYIGHETAAASYSAFQHRNDPTAKKFIQPLAVLAADNVQKERQPRNVLMYYKDASTANLEGLDRGIPVYGFNQLPSGGTLKPAEFRSRFSAPRKNHHISEMVVLNTDGTRFVFGIPAYNNTQKEVTFSVGNGSSAPGNCATGLVTYDPADATAGTNNKGKDNYVQSIQTPGYAYAYLLTGVVSPDYWDRSGDGITPDDPGTAIKFNYSLLDNAYNWRVPYGENQANYNEGKKSDFTDDKASYVYGTKELWYVHSVEGKNHIAMFYISYRNDALGVLGEHGGRADVERQYKLDSLVVYNKQDFYKNGVNAYKIKGVHFEYDYTLCGNVDNFESPSSHTVKGKLTLKKLYFTYGRSFKGKLSPYQFNYNNEGTGAYNYHLKGQDRWGVFTPAGTAACGSTSGLNSVEFPYTTQDKTDADTRAGAWCLSEVLLPSGGKIAVEYESDDYGYVQDRLAMRMFKIVGFGETNDYAGRDPDNELFKLAGNKIHKYIFINLEQTLDNKQLNQLMAGIQTAQFTLFADINGKGNNYEYVKAYADLEQGDYGLCNGGNSAYFAVKLVPIKDDGGGRQVHPLSLNIWNWTRMHAPEILYNQKVSQDYGTNRALKVAYELVGFANEIINMSIGIYANMRVRGFGKKIVPAKSWVRLNALSKTKLGGGHRVKSVKINDNWAYMGSRNTGAADYDYGQEYDYTLQERDVNGDLITVSSGVAAYEPNIGGDENAMHMPEYVREEMKWVPDNLYMTDVPYGESFMPPASVGYRKVTVKNLQRAGVERTATGKQVHEFYTAREFPVRRHVTDMQLKVIKPNFLQQLFNLDRKEERKVTAGQGYLFELNDMHGKPKAQYTYAENSKDPIAGVEYYYKTEAKDPTQLNNTVQVARPDGTVITREQGTEVELYNDFRQSLSEVTSAAVNTNLDFFTLAGFPFLIPSLYSGFAKNFSKVQTAVTVKVINRYGILQKQVAIKEGSRIQTENLVYDGVSGSLLVSSVQNEFEDNIYTTTVPAHWAYDQGMGPAYKNIGLKVANVTVYQDSIIFPNGLKARDYLVPGDECIYRAVNVSFPYHVYVYEGKNGKLNLNHADGSPIGKSTPTVCSIEVIRSGRRNLHNIPIQQITTADHPVKTVSGAQSLGYSGVLSASAVEYKDFWPFYCDKVYTYSCDTTVLVPPASLKSLFNSIASGYTLTNGRTSYNSTCVNNLLDSLGYDFSSTIYKKVVLESGISYVALTTDSCLLCHDSLFVQRSPGVYAGISQYDIKRCYTPTACCNEISNVRSTIAEHPFYQVVRTQMDSIFGTCVSDTTLQVSLRNCSSLSGNGNVELRFGRCGRTCSFVFEIPDNFCYKNILSIDSLVAMDNNHFAMNMLFRMPNGSTQTLKVTGGSDCLPLRKIDCIASCTTPTTSTLLNPYREGILGQWRMFRNYTYLTDRLYNSTTNRNRTDGKLSLFNLFWDYQSASGKFVKQPVADIKWVWASEVTKYTPYGNEVENRDALGRYSAAVFGFNKTLPIAVAGNAKYEQVAYDGFEENTSFWTKSDCFAEHFQVVPATSTKGVITKEYKHSGKYSLRVNEAEQVTALFDISTCSTAANILDSNIVKWNNCNCIGKFNPGTGKYIISAWIKEGHNALDTAYLNGKIQVKLHKTGGVITTLNFNTSGPVIEGWQRIFGEFTTDAATLKIEFLLTAANDDDVWFDDFRVHPFDASMKSYAYDQVTLKLLAELDDNNFASFYEYDAEGALIRVKKETTDGVKTLKEIRKQITKTP